MNIILNFLLCSVIKYGCAQFVSSQRQLNSPCEVSGTSLVEQFFNVIFAEFHNSPPCCVCVQMCPNQPTYCYPNECFKKQEKKDTAPVSKLQDNGADLMFLVDSQKGILSQVTGHSVAAYVSDSQMLLNSKMINRHSPMKEMLFKYKRIPTLEMKYNLREQVKQTKEKKTDVDVSKTRWPTNKQLNRQAYKINHNGNSNYFSTGYRETNQRETPKHLKRYLTKRENQNGSDIDALYLNRNASNSLETLIDKLIEIGLEGVNSTLELKIGNFSESRNVDKENHAKMRDNVTEYLFDSNFIDALTDDSEYKSNTDASNYTTMAYSKMITTLSDEIEKQNNYSMEAMESFIGGTIENLSSNIIGDVIVTNVNLQPPNNVTINVTQNELEITAEISKESIKPSTNTPFKRHHKGLPVINSRAKKSSQRIVRKLRNRKLY